MYGVTEVGELYACVYRVVVSMTRVYRDRGLAAPMQIRITLLPCSAAIHCAELIPCAVMICASIRFEVWRLW